jgi:hypothetical protein
MSAQFKQLAENSGFSKVLGNEASQFILFDKDTDGRSGRRLYINGALASKFTGMSPTAAETVFAKIKQLKATAGGMGSFSNLHNAMEHMTVIGSVGIRYKIFQWTGHQGHKAGVYVTDLDVGSFGGDSKPGLYKVSKNKGLWEVDQAPATSISTTQAAINGLCEGLEHAGTTVLPDMLASSFNSPNLSSEGYTLCYNPPSLYRTGQVWRTPSQKKTNKRVVAAHLKDALIDAQTRQQKVEWVIHSDGAHVLHDALQMAASRDLSCHTVMFLAPMAKLSTVLPLVRRSNISLHKDVMKTQSDDWRSKSMQMWDGRNAERELSKIPGFEARGAVIRGQARDDIHKAGEHLISSAAAGLGAGSFFLSPIMPTSVALAGMAWGGYGAYQKAKSLRNMVANKSTSAGLNPHMHPFKSKTEMDVHAKRHSGSTMKTFVDAARAYVTKA